MHVYPWQNIPEGVKLGKYASIYPRVNSAFSLAIVQEEAMSRAHFRPSFPCRRSDSGDVSSFGGGRVQRRKFSQTHVFARRGSCSFLLVRGACSSPPLRTPSACVLPDGSLAWRSSRLCQRILLHVCSVCVCLSGMKFVFQALTDWQGKQGCHFCFVLFLWARPFLALCKQSWDLGGYNLGCHV